MSNRVKVSYHDVMNILIGSDVIHLYSAREEIDGEPGEPLARRTQLVGPVLDQRGCLSSELSCYVQSFHVHTFADLDYVSRKFKDVVGH